MSDEEIILKAYQENWIIITNDKDFGELIFRDSHNHKGVIFMRLSDERSTNKIQSIDRLLDQLGDQIHGKFIVLTESGIRISE